MFESHWSTWNDVQPELRRLQNEMNGLFGRFNGGNGKSLSQRSFPALNVWEDNEQLLVEAELPGMEIENLDIYVNGGIQLSIKGERKLPSSEEGTWHRRERCYGKFSRVIELPHLVDPDKVNGSFKDGVLSIQLPKQQASKPRKIKIQAT